MATLITQLEQLENAQLVRRLPEEELAYLFKHGLTQESAYESLLLKKRREMHRRVAEAYERLYAGRLDEMASLLAHHFSQAGDDEKTVKYAIRAGDHARQRSANPEAGVHYAVALQALSRSPDTNENRRVQIDTLVKQAAVSFASVKPEQQLGGLRQAELVAEELLALDEASQEDRLRLARVHLWTARMHFYSLDRARAVENFRLVLPIAQELGDPELAALTSTLMARSLLWGGEFGSALPLLQQALAALEEGHNWTEWIVTDSLLGVVLAASGDYQAGVAEAERALGRSQELQHVSAMALAYPLLALVHLMGGHVEQALDESRTGVEVGLESENWLPAYSAFGMQAWAESRMGRHDAARTSMNRAEAIARKAGGHYVIDDWLAAVRAEMALNAGELGETLTRAEDAVTFARSANGKFAEAMAHRVWGQALVHLNPSHSEQADEHFAESLRLFEEGGARLEAARTHLVWGQVLQARGLPEAAREHFEQAAAQFESSGLTNDLERTKGLIAALPARMR